MVIDFRIRPPFKSVASMRHFSPQVVLPKQDFLQESMVGLQRKYMPSAARKDMDCLMREMDDAGVRAGIIMGRVNDSDPTSKHDNHDLLELASLYPDRFIPLASIDPSKDDYIEKAEQALSSGFAGLSFDLGYVPMYLNDERMFPLYELCDQKKCLISLAMSMLIGPDLTYSDPTQLGPIAKKFSNAIFYIPHSCWPFIAQAIGVSVCCKNVYLCPDLYMAIPNMPYARDLIDAANSILMKKIVFASSYPMRGIGQSVEEWIKLPLTDQARMYTMYYNGARILNL